MTRIAFEDLVDAVADYVLIQKGLGRDPKESVSVLVTHVTRRVESQMRVAADSRAERPDNPAPF